YVPHGGEIAHHAKVGESTVDFRIRSIRGFHAQRVILELPLIYRDTDRTVVGYELPTGAHAFVPKDTVNCDIRGYGEPKAAIRLWRCSDLHEAIGVDIDHSFALSPEPLAVFCSQRHPEVAGTQEGVRRRVI